MRTIDADALFAEFENVDWYNNADRDEIAERLVLQAPTIDAVSVVRGEWIEGGTVYFCGEQHLPLTCSICGRTALNEPWTYCPNCGAKMKGADDD